MVSSLVMRGRGLSPIRPGFLIKNVLASQVPAIFRSRETGELVEETLNEASITQLHQTYKTLIKRENQSRPKGRKLHGMTYESFLKYMKFARLMGLIEFVRDEPAIGIEDFLASMRLKKSGDGRPIYDRMKVVKGTQRVYKLTRNGELEGIAWGNLCRAWREDWLIPTAAPPELPEIIVRPTPPIPKVKKPIELVWKPMDIGPKANKARMKKLLAHLEVLDQIGIKDKTVEREVLQLTAQLADWSIVLEDTIKDAKTDEERDRLEGMYEAVEAVNERMMEDDLPGAIGEIKEFLG